MWIWITPASTALPKTLACRGPPNISGKRVRTSKRIFAHPLAGDGPAEHRAWGMAEPFLAHRLGDPRREAVDNGEGRFWCHVAGGEAGAAGGEDEVERPFVGPLTEMGGDVLDPTGHDGVPLSGGVGGT